MHNLLADGLAIIAINESWLTDSIPDSLLTDKFNYSVYRHDRSDRTGGGVCTLINNDVFSSVSVNLPPQFTHVDIVATDILNSHFKCRIINVYRSPTSNSDLAGIQYCHDLSNCIDSLCSVRFTTVIVGDFNLPDLHTQSDNPTCSSIINDVFTRHALTQYVSEPTRYSLHNNTATLLDLVLCNDDNFLYNVNVSFPFSTSDHCAVHFDLLKPASQNSPKNLESYDFKRADWASIFLFLNDVDFVTDFSHSTLVADHFTYFYNVLYNCISLHVPFIAGVKHRKNSTYPRHIRRELTRKKAAWRHYKQKRNDESLRRYKTAVSSCRSLIYAHHAKQEQSIVDRGNISAFYRYANRKLNTRTVIGAIKSPSDNSIVCDSDSKAEIFRQTFTDYYTIDNHVIPTASSRTSRKLSEISFTPSLIHKAIRKLRTTSKGGTDQIPTEFIKRCSLWLTVPLAYLFTASFKNHFLPPVWLTAFITPVFKKGDRTCPTNYRPIALTCVLCKIMESVIKDQLVSYLLSNNLITKHQHAFLLKHSTTTNLLESTRDWSLALNCHNNVDILYIDYQRAFDSIVHSKLLIKLQSYGVCGNLLAWISAFLSNRTQRVVIENSMSSVISVTSGIVQGSVIGPILFILYVNDISDLIVSSPAKLQLFADDLKLYSNLSCPSSSPNIQTIIDKIFDWSKQWQLSINASKCQCIRLHSRYQSATQPQYSIDNNTIPYSDNIRDLGILVDRHLSFNSHIDSITNKAAQRVGIIFRSFYSRDANFLLKAYTTYVRPLLEFNTIIWNPTLKKHIDKLEKIQRKFTKRIPSLCHLPYLQRLNALNLETLELRRLNFDLIYYYKILNNLTPHSPSDFFTYHLPPPSNRKNSPILVKPAKGSHTFLSSFCYRQIDCWNNLPEHLKNCNSLPSFKSNLKKLDINSYLYGRCYTEMSDFK